MIFYNVVVLQLTCFRRVRRSLAAILLIALAAALLGGGLAHALQVCSAVHSYPFVVGGKPLHTWPPFLLVPVAVALLSAVMATLISLLAFSRRAPHAACGPFPRKIAAESPQIHGTAGAPTITMTRITEWRRRGWPRDKRNQEGYKK